MITLNTMTNVLNKMAPTQSLKWAAHLYSACMAYDINTPQRLAMFVAQILHESGGLSRTEENLNYSAKRLLEVFPRYFKTAMDANSVVGHPDLIARRIYGGRMGNDPAPSNDGYSYRGRGLIQLTGKDNYKIAGASIGLDLVKNPGLAVEPSIAAKIAAWYFSSHGCNQHADKGDIPACTKAINGGLIGLSDRTALYHKALQMVTS
jgi:putative chitinase